MKYLVISGTKLALLLLERCFFIVTVQSVGHYSCISTFLGTSVVISEEKISKPANSDTILFLSTDLRNHSIPLLNDT
jgi:hypothetical protein